MIVGHKKQLDLLRKKFELEKLSHAYLFVGEDQIGKKSIAKEFAEIVGCKFPDLMLVESNDEKEISIVKIREVLNFLSYKSYNGGYKMVVIDNAERMNQEAQNCFLKTLEEPKGQTILILVSSHVELMLPTITSRCQIVKFYRPNNLPENLEKIKKEQKVLEELIKVINSDFGEKFQYTKKINFEEQGLKDILEILQRYLRHLLFVKTKADETANQEHFPIAVGKLKDYSVLKLKDILRLIEKLNTQTLLTNASPKLALEILLMEM